MKCSSVPSMLLYTLYGIISNNCEEFRGFKYQYSIITFTILQQFRATEECPYIVIY